MKKYNLYWIDPWTNIGDRHGSDLTAALLKDKVLVSAETRRQAMQIAKDLYYNEAIKLKIGYK